VVTKRKFFDLTNRRLRRIAAMDSSICGVNDPVTIKAVGVG
jgi:hypothetical protein